MINVRDVVFDYPNSRALHGVSFDLEQGAVLALVGPNGAGKTTLMRCIAALDAPLFGQITVAGLDAEEDPRGVHGAIGYLPDFYGLYDDLSVRRSLIYAARSRGVAATEAEAAARRAAGLVQIEDRLDQAAGELSRGLRQRLAIAQTIVHGPKVLLLDEPAAGLDPEARRSLSDLISRLAAEGMTIVVSSHILAELEDYSTRMLMIRDGRIAGGGVVQAAPAEEEATRVLLGLAAPIADLTARLAELGFRAEGVLADEAVLHVPGDGEAQAEALARLIAAGLPVRLFQPQRRTLEDTYLAEARRPTSEAAA